MQKSCDVFVTILLQAEYLHCLHGHSSAVS